MCSFRSMQSSFPILVFVAESGGCIKHALWKWAQKSHQLLSIRITQKKLRGHAPKKIWFTKLSIFTKIIEVTVCIFLIQQIWSHFQKTYNKLIIQPNFTNVFCDKVVCVPFIHHRKMRAVEIIGAKDCHDIHVFTSGCKLLTMTVSEIVWGPDRRWA